MLKRTLGIFTSLLLSASVLATPAGDNILISEVAYDVVGAEPAREWFELFNPTASPIDISGWTITDGEGTVTVPATTVINAGDYFLATHTEAEFHVLYPAVPVGLAYGAIDVGSIFLANGGDSLSLSDVGGNEVDFVAWKNKVPGWNIEASQGKTITRKGNLDSDLDSDWASEQNPTPGEGPGFTLSKTSSSIIEGAADTFTVVLDTQPTTNVVIDISTSDIAAVGVVPTILTFTPANWNMPQPVNITGVEDDDDLFDESVTITVAINDAASDDTFDHLINQTVSVAVADNDLAKISINDITHDEAHSGDTDYIFTISIDYPSPDDITVEYATADGSATLIDNDYIAVALTQATITAGNTNTTIIVESVGDHQVESDETFTVNLSNPINASIDDNQGDAIIVNDDTAELSIDDVTLNEGTGGANNVIFTVKINNPSDSDITVEYATADGTAMVGDNDYSAVPTTTATITAGMLSTTVAVEVATDNKVENTEIFLVELSNAVGATIVDSSAMGIITNDDNATLSIDDVSHVELNAGNVAYTFTVSTDNPSDSDITFKYKTSDATATSADNDYLVTALTDATIMAGHTSTTVTVLAVGDLKVESDEQFNVELSSAIGALIGDSLGVATIVNNDVAGFDISPTNIVVDEGELTTFSIVLTAQPITDVAFEIESSDGGAAGFAPDSGILTTVFFTPDNWNIPQLVSVTGIEDADLSDENVTLTALVFAPTSDPAFSGLASKAVILIVNDDDIDTDNDGIADEEDPDIDNDGNPNGTDPNPLSPVSTDDFVETMGTESIIFNILMNDDFGSGVNTRIDRQGGTAIGSASFDANTGELTYTPDASEEGSTITLGYRVCNTAVIPEVCGQATITLAVAAAPVVPPSSIPTLSEWMLLLLSALLLLVGLRQGREKNM